jgi:hypothetical protein
MNATGVPGTACRPVVIGAEDEMVLPVGDPVKPEFAEPSELLTGGGYKNFWPEGHSVTTVARHVHNEPVADFGDSFDADGAAPFAIAREVRQHLPHGSAVRVDVNVGIYRDARHC